MTGKKEITVYDLAKELKISIATVSRALNNSSNVSKKTKSKVSELAEQLGYQQNSFAKNLRKSKTYTIGVIVHELNSLFIVSVLKGIEKATAAASYNIIIGHSAEQYTKEAANVLNFFHKRVDGIIASLAGDTTTLAHYEPFVRKGIPIVFFDRVKKGDIGIKVVIDNYKAAREVVSHLVEQGCKHIVHVTGNLLQNVYADRWKGFRDVLEENKLPCRPEQLIIIDFSEESGVEAARKILETKKTVDGVFIANDMCAAACMQKLKEAGMSIPGDIAIAGFNNDQVSRLVEPALTTVNYAGEEMGEAAARCLVDQLNGHLLNAGGYTITLPAQLFVRESSLRKRLD